MGVDWNATFGDYSRPLGGREVSKHAAIHHPREGFGWRNPPEGELRSEWSRLLRSGGPLYSHWGEDMDEHQISQSYILTPFLGSFIFFSPIRKMSGDRPVTEIHTRISQDYDSLSIEVANERGGVAIPPPHSIGSGGSGRDVATGLLEVESSHDSGLGISTLLFQPQGLRDITGVACGVDRTVLEECFPEVNQWILETVTNTVDGSPKRGRSPLQSMVAHGADDPLGTLERFRALETLSKLPPVLPGIPTPTIEDLISILEKDEGRASPIRPTREIIARMSLLDREGALQLLNPDSLDVDDLIDLRDRCAIGWMPLARVVFDGVNFPFSHSELSILEKGPSKRCFDILNECLRAMRGLDEYGTKSDIAMAAILSKHGNQNQIEDVWKSIAPIGQEEMSRISDSILEWRDNPKISDFWGLLIILEGDKDVDFRRNLCHQIIYQSANEDDLKGIIRYIPDLINSEEKLDFDWLILDRLGLHKSTIVQHINHVQPSAKKIQRRIILSIDHLSTERHLRTDRGGDPASWHLGELIPRTSQILHNPKWIKPILEKIYELRKIYREKFSYPADAYDWIRGLSPEQYLECSKDKVLRRYLSSHLIQRSRPSSSWPLPKAMPVDYTAVEANDSDSVREIEWARLVAEPTHWEKISYRRDVITKQLSNLSFVCLVVCLLSPIAIIANFKDDLGPYGEYAGFALSLSFLGLGFFVDKIINNPSNRDVLSDILDYFGALLFLATVAIVISALGASLSGSDFFYQEFSGLQIPIPNNPLISGTLVVVFWQAYGVLREKANLHQTKKENFLEAFKG